MKTWTLELTIDELIALVRAASFYVDETLAKRHLTLDELQTLNLLNGIDDRLPDDEWFPEEVSA